MGFGEPCEMMEIMIERSNMNLHQKGEQCMNGTVVRCTES